MRQAGLLLGNDANYDAFSADARALYWKQCNDGIFKYGVDAWWCDCTEPFEADWRGKVKPEPWKRLVMNVEQFKKYLDPEFINAYSLLHSQGIYEGQRSVRSDKRVVNLTRSSYPGQQRYGTITWSGDVSARWEVLRKQIADGLNFCMTGNPRWTLDVGGFFVAKKEQWFWNGDYPRGCEDPAYRELYVRWFQLGCFLPMFRSHGTDTPREIWRFGEPGTVWYDTLVKFLHLRYRLLPYIYSVAAWETHRDYTMMRALAFDFRHDPTALLIDDQFMFGPAMLVCPVTQGGVSSRRVYLPAGCDWIDFWTNRRYAGGQTIDAAAPLSSLPLFVRGGSIIPMGPVVQHANEQPHGPIELRVHGGADASFDVYDDEGDGYGYESGGFVWIPIRWNDSARCLTLGQQVGGSAGMPQTRRFDVIIDGVHAGTIDYTGQEQSVPACANR
jgi:alpha-D-xyloside xylohydrolase